MIHSDTNLLCCYHGRRRPYLTFYPNSVAGLFSARICNDHFTSVVVVEPEAWLNADSSSDAEVESSSEPKYRISEDNVRNLINPRKRVMHYPQRHSMLTLYIVLIRHGADTLSTRADYQAILLQILHRLFPDIEEEAALLGATYVFTAFPTLPRSPSELRLQPRPQPADWKFTPSGIPFPFPREEFNEETMPRALFLTRHGFETLLRKLVVKHCPQVKFVNGTVEGINPSSGSDRTVLESVTIQDSRGEKSWQQDAALVVGTSRGGNTAHQN